MSRTSFLKKCRFPLAAAALCTLMAVSARAAEEPIKVGLVAALSGQSAKSGEALTRGLTVAINEINAAGGIKGRPLMLIRREKVAVLFGGLDTPVSLAIVPLANQLKMPFVGIWAAGTGITQNGAKDNYVFRVSAVDERVDEALVDYGINHKGMKKPGVDSTCQCNTLFNYLFRCFKLQCLSRPVV